MGNLVEILLKICQIVFWVYGIGTFTKIIYITLGLIKGAPRYKDTSNLHKYAVVIAARNEEIVIGNLINSIKNQNYDQTKVTVFVVADNCTDNTAMICRQHGAVVYEHTDDKKRRKGYALEYLFDMIQKDYGIDYFEGYFVFDADNILAPEFIKEMNKAFDKGHKVVTAYRNIKNFSTNFISAAYGIHFYQNSVVKHRPRSILHIGTHLTGTGYLIASEFLKDGWHYTNFTEDDQLTSVLSSSKVKIAYCEAAEFFDEQPVDIKTVYNQRVRWAKGRLINFFQNAPKLLKGIFKNKSFTCFDMFFHYFPLNIFKVIQFFCIILPVLVSLMMRDSSLLDLALVFKRVFWVMIIYAWVFGLATLIREHKHIHCPVYKQILYLFLYPWFSVIGLYVYFIAMIKRVDWKPIKHDDNSEYQDILNAGSKQSNEQCKDKVITS